MNIDQAERICSALERIATALERGGTLGVEPKGMPVSRVEHPLDREEQFQCNAPKKLTIKAIVEETDKQINKAMFVVKHAGIWKNGGYVPAPQPEVSAETVAKALKEQGYDVEKIE